MSDRATFAALPTAAIADAAVRLQLDVPSAPPTMRMLGAGHPVAGLALPVTHEGSVDAFLAIIDDARPGSVLVVDNGGRDDEACVGDLIALEAHRAGLAAIVIWGRHRDTEQLRQIGLPIVSCGAHPYGPRRAPATSVVRRSARLGYVPVTPDDLVVLDEDGVLVVRPDRREELLELAASIRETEAAQADRMRQGVNLRAQVRYTEYRKRQRDEPSLTLREHLRDIGGAVET
ncbi:MULTISPECIES: RraA family protein [Microcella]|jgi:4-hydroxy-4-methyl-2-oxoglutarate aldolase|uniref:RraA family protein n=1 Tax=Microcella TaxID=337004 RepID=UPI0015CF10F1|nr:MULTISPECIES: RraA family protein [Microcella]QOD94090.1 RraA family protein [Chryseoglobus sp. 28M-23]